MKRGTAVLAFAATAMTLGLVVWLARAQTPGESGFVIPGTIAHHPVVTVSRGETLLAYGINKSPAGPALDVAIQFLDSNGIELIRQMCTAPAGGFCSVSFTGSDCGGSSPCRVWAVVMVEAPSTPPPTADGGVPTAFEWSTTLELLDHRGISKFVTGPIPNFAVVPNPGGGTGTDGGA